MSEVKTQPVTARRLPANEFRTRNVPGSFHVEDADEDGELSFWYCCPCGCGRSAPLVVGNGFKPHHGPSWNWNGDREKPTLSPSVHHVGHWHGWLQAGVWTSC